MDIPPQAQFFFKGKWSPELDNQLLGTVVRMKEEMHFVGPGIPEEAIVQARAKIEADVGCGLSSHELKDRLQLLESRFETFNVVVSTPGVCWYPTLRVVHAADSVWLQLLKCLPFAAAYYHEDEAEYRRLSVVFGPLDVKQEISEGMNVGGKKEIVILSDSTPHLRDVIDLTACDSPFSEEVNSPVTLICEKVRRKLFDHEVESSDRESSNKPSPIYYVPGPEGKPIMKTASGRRMPVQLHVPSPKSSPGGSSQASNSPNPRADLLRR